MRTAIEHFLKKMTRYKTENIIAALNQNDVKGTTCNDLHFFNPLSI